MANSIYIKGARVHNLKDVDVAIPRDSLVVITGMSGSGKSSLAFDTLFAEGQRRFAESLSSYARQFLGRMSKPDVELIEGIPPAIAIEQKVNTRNPRSTIATSTEIFDYLRMIFARIGRTYSPVTGLEVKCHTVNDVMACLFEGDVSAAYILADLNWEARQDKLELMLQLKEEGYSRFFADKVVRIEDVMQNAQSGEYPQQIYLLIDLKQTGAAGNAVSLQGGGNRKTDGFVGACGIRYHQTVLHRVEASFNTFHRGIEGLQVNGDIGFVFHDSPPC